MAGADVPENLLLTVISLFKCCDNLVKWKRVVGAGAPGAKHPPKLYVSQSGHLCRFIDDTKFTLLNYLIVPNLRNYY